MKDRKTHQWTTFRNPRNGRVVVSACLACGVMKDPLAHSIPCEITSIEQNAMTKMGWFPISDAYPA